MNDLTLLREAGPEAPALTPAARAAARAALLAEVDASRTLRGRLRTSLPGRRLSLRIGAAVVAVAAAWTTAVVVAPDDAVRQSSAPPSAAAPAPGGITLVAAEAVTFPVTLDPVPEGLTPLYSRRGGIPEYGSTPPYFVADYEPTSLVSGGAGSGDPGRVLLSVFPEDPRTSEDYGFWPEGEPTGAATVDGIKADVWSEDGAVSLLWERPDGRWVWLAGEGARAEVAGLVAMGESIVDRPQAVGLQFGLAPAGWSVGGYEESRSLDLVSDADPVLALRLSAVGTQYTGTMDELLEGMPTAAPTEPVTVQGRDGRLALLTGDVGQPPFWTLIGQLPDGRFFRLLAPQALTRGQVLQIGEQVTAAP
ncbi:hypothetical protein ACI798_22320 [Geodermatophilus sp. SYSU D01045]